MSAPTPYDRYLDIDEEIETKGKSPERWRRMQEAVRDALWDHAQGKRPLSEEIAAALKFEFDEVVARHSAELFTPIRTGRGSPGRSSTEKRCIEDAVRYWLACIAKKDDDRAREKPLIDDPDPIRTIHAAFGGYPYDEQHSGFQRSTIRKWKRRNDPDFGHVRIGNRSATRITKLMEHSGRFYARNYLWAGRKRRVWEGKDARAGNR